VAASSPVPPNTLIYTSGITVADNPKLAGTVVVDELIPYRYEGRFPGPPGTGKYVNSGTIQTRVVQTATGTMDFYWRVMADSTSGTPVQGIAVVPFGTLSDVFIIDYRVDGLGDVPLEGVARNNDTAYVFQFLHMNLPPGKSSNFFFAETTATSFAKIAPVMVWDAFINSPWALGYGPAQSIPLKEWRIRLTELRVRSTASLEAGYG